MSDEPKLRFFAFMTEGGVMMKLSIVRKLNLLGRMGVEALYSGTVLMVLVYCRKEKTSLILFHFILR